MDTEYYFMLIDGVREQSFSNPLISIKLKDYIKTHPENILQKHTNIINNIGFFIKSSKNSKNLSDFSEWNFILNNVKTNINVCAGKYSDCRHNEVTTNDLKNFYSNLSNNKSSVLQNSHPINKCIEDTNEDNKDNNIITLSKKNEFVNNENDFKTAQQELLVQQQKYGQNNQGQQRLFSYGTTKRYVGSKFKKPEIVTNKKDEVQLNDIKILGLEDDDRLRNIDENMIKLISNEIMHKFKPINWEDIAGLEYAKSSIQEAVVWPILRPDIFTGLRRPPRGILLFGPPGTGKTLIGKCIASQSKSTFFSISASSLTSKWIGEGEKMVRALFAVAAVKQPSVIFIDEIDSLLCQRSETEHESSRRLKTEFLVQLDGAGTRENERLLIVGATNRPQELDEAARRRFVRRLYIPLPDFQARIQILKNLLLSERNEVTENQFIQIGQMSEGYSAADMESLCREASMEPIRSIPPKDIPLFNEKNVRGVNYNDFLSAFKRIRSSVSPNELEHYEKWNQTFGANK